MKTLPYFFLYFFIFSVFESYSQNFSSNLKKIDIAISESTVGEFSDGLCSFLVRDPTTQEYKRGFFDLNGNIVISPRDVKLIGSKFTDGLCPVYSNQLMGFINNKDELVIPYKYNDVSYSNFTNGFLLVYQGKKGVINNSPDTFETILLIDKSGKELFRLNGVDIWISRHISQDGLLVAYNYKTQKYGFVDLYGKINIPFKYDKVENFSEGFAAVLGYNEYREKRWGFINKNGDLVIDYIFSVQPGYFKNGVALVKEKSTDGYSGKYGYIDGIGNLIIETKFTHATDFSNGFALVRTKEGLVCLIDTKESISFKNENSITEYTFEKISKNFEIFDNMFVSQRDWSPNLYLINTNGTPRVNTHCYMIKNFKNGLAYAECYGMAKNDNKTIKGFINTKGEFVIIGNNSGY